MVPVIHLTRFAGVVENARFYYISSVGFIIVLVSLVEGISRKKMIRYATFSALVFLYLAGLRINNISWMEEKSFSASFVGQMEEHLPDLPARANLFFLSYPSGGKVSVPGTAKNQVSPPHSLKIAYRKHPVSPFFTFVLQGGFTYDTGTTLNAPPIFKIGRTLPGVSDFFFGWDGKAPVIHNVTPVFERIKALQDASGESDFPCSIFFGTTLSSGNLNFLDEMLDAVSREIKGTGWNDFHLNLAHESAHYYGNLGRVHGDNGSARKLVEELIRRRDRSLSPVMILERIYQGKLLDYLETGTTPVPCQAMRASCFIDPYWNLFPCSIFDLPLGNLRDSGFSLTDIWEAPETQSARKKISDGRCPHCWTPCEAYQSILSGLSRGSFFPG